MNRMKLSPLRLALLLAVFSTPSLAAGSSSNASVAPTGSTVPSSATLFGYRDSSGNLVAPSTSAGLPISGSAIQPLSGGGWTPTIKTGLTNSVVLVKSSAATLGVIHCDNPNTSTVYVEFFNAAGAVLGTTAPTWFAPIPAGGGGLGLTSGVYLGGSAVYAAAVTGYNGSTAPSSTLTCSIGAI